MNKTASKSLIGKHVYIVGEHPRSGDHGEITEYYAGIDVFVVKLAGTALECFVDEAHLRCDRRESE